MGISMPAYSSFTPVFATLPDAAYLNNHNILTNKRLGDIQTQLIEQDGKIVGLQTEIRQRFTEQNSKITGLQTTQAEQTIMVQQILARLPEKPQSS